MIREFSCYILLVKAQNHLPQVLGYVNIFTPVQSNFLSDLQKKYHCLDSANIVLYYAKKTHQAILRKKEYDLNYNLSFETFWDNQNEADVMGINPVFTIILALIFIPYTWFANLIGALISYISRSKSN